jgi:hypothetical protein
MRAHESRTAEDNDLDDGVDDDEDDGAALRRAVGCRGLITFIPV